MPPRIPFGTPPKEPELPVLDEAKKSKCLVASPNLDSPQELKDLMISVIHKYFPNSAPKKSCQPNPNTPSS
jgi:hypothetical protein